MINLHSFAKALCVFVLLLLCPLMAKAQVTPEWQSWNNPVQPARIIGNLYYIGASDVSAFLITTPKGHILIDGGFDETVPLIQASMKQLGFKIEDVKILLNSHAHADHAGGLATLKQLTGAKLFASKADAELLVNGGKGDFQWGDKLAFKPVKVDRTFQDKETVELGDVKLTARLTPGHTKGATTWTLKVKEGDKVFDVVIISSASVPGYTLINNSKYPKIIEDYAHTFQVLKSLPCDVFLGPHGNFFGLLEKLERLKKDPNTNPFIDSKGLSDYVETAEKNYLKQLEKERQAK
jgi:metallo-beta-lactamase class B